MSLRHSKSRARAGFTLVELMVVLVIIGIMAAMIIPEMRGTYEEALLRSNSRQWMDVINLAYSRTVTGNQAHRIRIDRVSGQYFVERRTPAAVGQGGFVPIKDDSTGTGKLDPRITIEFRQPSQETADASSSAAPGLPEESPFGEREETIAFYPDGTADAREILLQDRAGFRLALRINPTTARVHVVDLKHK